MTTVVRVCEATYDANLVVKEGIQVLVRPCEPIHLHENESILILGHVLTLLFAVVQDWPFDDGAPPSNQIVDDWLNLLRLKFREEPGCCIAVHCVAGLGR